MADRALLVGINLYPGQPLHGCVNDVTDMADFLVRHCGFDAGDIRLLTDARATTYEIMDRLGWLLTGVDADDRILFHFSGHGALFPVRNAQGKVTTVYDAICPVDFDWTRERAILSTDFHRIFSTVPKGTELVFVSDSCNSGDLARAMRQFNPKFLAPPADIAWRLRTADLKSLEPALIRSAIHDNCAFISGCRSDQESADAIFNGQPNGALTHYLLEALGAAGGLNQPMSKLVPGVHQLLRQGHYSQVPRLHGPGALLARPFLSTVAAPAGRRTSGRKITRRAA